MKTIFTLFMLFSLTAFSQSETRVTNILNNVCQNINCNPIELGNCPEETNSEGEEYQFTDFHIYYSDENIFLNAPGVILENARLEMRDGANFIDNGWFVQENTQCDDEFTTELVFIGGGQRFSSVEEMTATLSIQELEQQNIIPLKVSYYNILGKEVDIKTASNGMYFKRHFYPNNVVKTTKIIN